jgi:hypothetical protein
MSDYCLTSSAFYSSYIVGRTNYFFYVDDDAPFPKETNKAGFE